MDRSSQRFTLAVGFLSLVLALVLYVLTSRALIAILVALLGFVLIGMAILWREDRRK